MTKKLLCFMQVLALVLTSAQGIYAEELVVAMEAEDAAVAMEAEDVVAAVDAEEDCGEAPGEIAPEPEAVIFDTDLIEEIPDSQVSDVPMDFDEAAEGLLETEVVSTDQELQAEYQETAFSDEVTEVTNSVSSEEISFTYDETTNTLSFSGKGTLGDFTAEERPEWESYASCAKEIIFQEGITYIGSFSFYRFLALEKVILPSTVTGIGKSAFAEAEKLNEINFPDGLVTICEYAFQNTALAEISLPASLKELSPLAFYGVDTQDQLGMASDENQQLFSLEQEVPEEELIISEEITAPVLGGGISFTYDETTFTLTISGSGAIGDYNGAVRPEWEIYNTSAKHIIFQEGITYIGAGSFYCFPSLEKVTLPSTVTRIGEGAFAESGNLKEIIFSEGLVTIDEYAFQNTALETVSLPATLREMTSLSFFGVDTIKSFSVAPQNQVFSSEGGILFSRDKTRILLYPAGLSAETYQIPYGITEIGDYAFYLVDIREIQIPSSVTRLGEGAFYRSKIVTLTIPDSVLEASDYFASGCPCLKEVRFGTGIREVPYMAFRNCRALNKIYFNNKLEGMGYLAFADCTALEEITIPEGIRYIKNGCFRECSALRTIHFPATLEEIWYQAFINCKSLETLSLPSSLKSINRYAFYGTGIKEVTLPSGIRLIGEKAFPDQTVFRNLSSELVYAEDGSYRILYNLPIDVTYDYAGAFQVLNLVNKKRAAQGLTALAMDSELLDAAMQRAAEISVFFSHTRPSGMDVETICQKINGENIAGYQISASAVMDSWMNSPGHRGNILRGSYSSVGIGAVIVNGRRYWVQCFSSQPANVVQASAYKDYSRETMIAFDFLDDEDFFVPTAIIKENGSGNYGKDIEFEQRQSKTIVFGPGKDGYLNAEIKPGNLVYESGDPGVCAVSADGRITGLKEGSTTIKVSLRGVPDFSASVNVKVKETPQETEEKKPSEDTTKENETDTPKIETEVEETPQETEEKKPSEDPKKEIESDTPKIETEVEKTPQETEEKKPSEDPKKENTLETPKNDLEVTETPQETEEKKPSEDTTKKNTLKIPKIKSAVSNSYNSIKITWGKVSGAASYTLYYKKEKNGKWIQLASKLKGTSYVHKKLVTGKDYWYTVKAVSNKSVSGYDKNGVKAKPVLNKTNLNSVKTISKKGLKLSWKKVSGATGYTVYVKKNNKWVKKTDTKKLYYLDKSVKRGKKYIYKVRAYRTVNKKKIYGPYSSARTKNYGG